MRKRLIILLLGIIGLSLSAAAQYHITGDTVEYLDSVYWRPQWYDEFCDSINHITWPRLMHECCGGNGEFLMTHVTDRPLRVIGIACAANISNWATPWIETNNTAVQEYFVLYKKTRGGRQLKRSVPWYPTEPHRKIKTRIFTFNSMYGCDSITRREYRITNLYESYFEDLPVVLTDTFYIGATTHSAVYMNEGHPVYYAASADYMSYYPCPEFPFMEYIYALDSNCAAGNAGDTVHYYERQLWYVFPILSQDTNFDLLDSCPTSNHLHFGWEDSIGRVLLWDADSLHTEWEVCIGDTGTMPNDAYFDTVVNTPYLALDSLGLGASFRAHVRSLCLNYEDYLVRSDWSEGADSVETVLEIPDTCLPVNGLQHSPMEGGYGMLTWDTDTMHTEWEVCIGAPGMTPDSTYYDTVVNVPFLAIDSSAVMGDTFEVRVRAHCLDAWSDWSDSIVVVVEHEPIGIADAEGANGSTTLRPNPTDRRVTVTSTDRLLHIGAYDMAGHQVLDLIADGTSITFDVEGWANATYIVLVRTVHGTTAHRLVVKTR